MRMTLGELARRVNGTLEGDADAVITGVAGVREAAEGDITYAANARYAALLEAGDAAAAVVSEGLKFERPMALIRVRDAEAAFTEIARLFAPEPIQYTPGVHPAAVVAEDASLGKDVTIGPCVVIEPGARIGARTVLRANCFVGRDTVIGEDCLIWPNVTICDRVSVGSRCIIHSGSVIGSDGFGYVTQPDGRHVKIPQIGTVIIEDDVEVGACVTIDRARFNRTLIGRGTKIDNLVQIGHNSIVGKHCILVSMVGLCGSAHLGDHVTLAGRTSVGGHVSVGNRVIVGALSGVARDVPDGMVISGYPAQNHREQLKLSASLQRVPLLFERVKDLEKKLSELERATDDAG